MQWPCALPTTARLLPPFVDFLASRGPKGLARGTRAASTALMQGLHALLGRALGLPNPAPEPSWGVGLPIALKPRPSLACAVISRQGQGQGHGVGRAGSAPEVPLWWTSRSSVPRPAGALTAGLLEARKRRCWRPSAIVSGVGGAGGEDAGLLVMGGGMRRQSGAEMGCGEAAGEAERRGVGVGAAEGGEGDAEGEERGARIGWRVGEAVPGVGGREAGARQQWSMGTHQPLFSAGGGGPPTRQEDVGSTRLPHDVPVQGQPGGPISAASASLLSCPAPLARTASSLGPAASSLLFLSPSPESHAQEQGGDGSQLAQAVENHSDSEQSVFHWLPTSCTLGIQPLSADSEQSGAGTWAFTGASSLLPSPPFSLSSLPPSVLSCLEVESAPLSVAVLLSGGVDSSVALRLLHAAGHRCVAYYLKIWFQEDFRNTWEACPWEEDLGYAQAVCDAVGVELRVLPLTQEYWALVVSHCMGEIKAGRTPNPDMLCNARIKFGAFFDHVDFSAFDRVASGHYARIVSLSTTLQPPPFVPGPGIRNAVGLGSVTRQVGLSLCSDPVKDQTYFLAGLSPSQLSRCMFPLGALTKGEVRRISIALGLPNSRRRDSQGICFLGKVKFGEFVAEHIGERAGRIVEAESGDPLGFHRGFWFYTIGQRQGIRLSGGPWYVVAKDTQHNVVFVSRAYHSPDKRRRQFWVGPLSWALPVRALRALEREAQEGAEAAPLPSQSLSLLCKVRHGAKVYECSLEMLQGEDGKDAEEGGGGSMGVEGPRRVGLVTLGEDDQGLAAGQYAVFYAKQDVLPALLNGEVCSVAGERGDWGMDAHAEQAEKESRERMGWRWAESGGHAEKGQGEAGPGDTRQLGSVFPAHGANVRDASASVTWRSEEVEGGSVVCLGCAVILGMPDTNVRSAVSETALAAARQSEAEWQELEESKKKKKKRNKKALQSSPE